MLDTFQPQSKRQSLSQSVNFHRSLNFKAKKTVVISFLAYVALFGQWLKYLIADRLFQSFHACSTYLLFSTTSIPSNAWRKADDCKPLMTLPSSATPNTFQWIADSPGWIWLDSHLDGGILQAQSLFPAHSRTMLLLLLWPGWHEAPSNISHQPPDQLPPLL